MTVQYGALPYRFNEAGALEVLLITTKQSKRWIIPKGRPIGGLKPAKCAAREAFEEAGVRGAVGKKPIGAFRFVKTVGDSLSLLCRVRVYPMKVKRHMRSWPEVLHRTQRWVRARRRAGGRQRRRPQNCDQPLRRDDDRVRAAAGAELISM